jgi:hypothetical protein
MLVRFPRLALAALALASAATALPAGATTPVTPAGRALASVLDSLDVEQHWRAGVHVHWESGEPDGRRESTEGRHTHCSAFVAAAAKKVGVYILRPPDHKQMLLANAQYDWLETDGRARGWTPVADAVQAQAEANRGRLVVATYRNHHEDKPGHIAIVRPSERSDDAVRRDGPAIIQAGTVNYRETDLRTGFAGHPSAWGRHEVRFYSHEVETRGLR